MRPMHEWPAAECARFYLAHHTYPIPVPFRSKKPVLKDWPGLRLTLETIPDFFNGGPLNIGAILGASDLIDLDLDCPEAVELAHGFLPPTSCRFGRQSTGISHWLYRVAPALPTTQFEDVEKGADGTRQMLVEFRGDGGQTLMPGSVHPSGEPIVFVTGAEIFQPTAGDGAALLHQTRLLACACLLARHWPDSGSRHAAALAASGVLANLELPVEEAMLVIVSAARAGGDEEAQDRRRDVLSTFDQRAAGGPVRSGPSLAEHLRGDGAAVVRRLRGWFKMHVPGEARWTPPTTKPVIDTGNLDLADMTAAAYQAIERANDPPRVYGYGNGIAWIGTDLQAQPQVERLGRDQMRYHLAEVASFIRWAPAGPGRTVQKPAFPPTALATNVLVVPRRTLPRLHRLVRAPAFLKDGRLLTQPGFDADSGLYYAKPSALEIPPISETPSPAEVAAARTLLLEEWLGDFPWGTPSDAAHAIALLLTPLVRELIDGCTPLFIVSKPTPRTGAGLLMKVLTRVMSGTATAPKMITPSEEENEKRMLAFLIPSPAVILFDNLRITLNSATLSAVLTAWPTWAARLLGKSVEVEVPVRSVLAITGNHVRLSNELTDRGVLIWMDPKVEHPGLRTDFRHPRLEAWTAERRGALLGAALTLVQSWVAAGRPVPTTGPTKGGFQEWVDVLGGILEVAGIPGLLANQSQLVADTDEETGLIKAFVADWKARFGTALVVTKELFDTAKGHPLDIQAKTDQGSLIRLGRLIGDHADRPYTLGDETVYIRRRKDDRDGVNRWQLEVVPAGSAGSAGNGTRHADYRGSAKQERPVASPASPASPADPEAELFEEPAPASPPAADGPLKEEHSEGCDCSSCIPPGTEVEDW